MKRKYMPTNKERILNHLRSVYPEGRTNSDICATLKIEPHQQVFQITRNLMIENLIRGQQQNHEWTFYANMPIALNEELLITTRDREIRSDANAVEPPPTTMTPHQFELLARRIMSNKFQEQLSPRETPGVPKIFDLVSDDFSIIGDVKYYTLVRGRELPPAKFATIAEYVWLLEKTQAKIKFLVFGNDIRVPKMWLQKYGDLATNVDFYFLSNESELIELA